MRVVVLAGIPGSGKSTYARRLAAECKGASAIVSADDFFVDSATGAYRFNRAMFGGAHAKCLRDFLAALARSPELIVVDNTHTTAAEAAPYMALAPAFGGTAELHELRTPVWVAARRGVHRVPRDVCERFERRLRAERWPAWWTVRRIQGLEGPPKPGILHPPL